MDIKRNRDQDCGSRIKTAMSYIIALQKPAAPWPTWSRKPIPRMTPAR